MPKNPHPPRGGSAKKSVPPAEDTSYIVFGDGKPKKGKKGERAATSTEDSKSKGPSKGKASAVGQPEDAPKQPDTRTLIGSASWTGKLPVNMFAEPCQKQKWSKPDYR